jgi:1,4-dihydroxy-2-naphthoyl-CoA hydrolase
MLGRKSIWFSSHTVESVSHLCRDNMLEHLDIKVEDIGSDFIVASMPVDHRTVQPMRILHGGASVALAESLGSIGSYLTVDQSLFHCVGIEVNANHLKSVTSGRVFAKASPIRLGKKIQVWNIEIKDEKKDLVCVSRLTMAVLPVRASS